MNPIGLSGPISQSIHFNPATNRLVRIYGDDHSQEGNPGGTPIENELLFRLNTEPNLDFKVFGEFISGEPQAAFPNNHLPELNQMYNENIGGHRTTGRLMSTNSIRDNIIRTFDDRTDEATEEDEDIMKKEVKRFIKAVDRKFASSQPFLMGKTKQEKQQIKKERKDTKDELLKRNKFANDDLSPEDYRELTTTYANPLVEQEAISHLKHQPANSEYVFYIGDGHKDELDRILPLLRPQSLKFG
jgi:hypothetical protein